jgi:hypothetical protein
MKVKPVSRETLYEQVWSTPMSRLASTYGASDVGLAKACDRHNIPRPGRGHWAKPEHGKPVRQVPLPPCDAPEMQTIRLEKAGTGSTRVPTERGMVAKRVPVTVSDRLSSPLPLVAATKRKLEYTKPGPDGLIRTGNSGTLNVVVSRRSIGRAMRVLDAILKHWERIGGAARGDPGGHPGDGPSGRSENGERPDRRVIVGGASSAL